MLCWFVLYYFKMKMYIYLDFEVLNLLLYKYFFCFYDYWLVFNVKNNKQ